MIREYCKLAGFYSYDAAADDDDPSKHWIGREVKRFIANAHLHLPFLLQVAAAPIDCIPELAACVDAQGEEEMDEDVEYAPTEEQAQPPPLRPPSSPRRTRRSR